MGTIADTIRSAISAGKTNEEVLAAVKAAHPDSNTSSACVSYYRSKMKKAGGAPAAPKTPKAPKQTAIAKAVNSGHGYSVKGVKFFRGNEGYGFNATLYRDGKAIAFVYDDATGGMLGWEWRKDVDVKAEEALLKAHVAALPPISGCGVSIPVDVDLYVDGLVQDAQLLKDAQKFIKAGTAFVVGKDLYTTKSPPTEATLTALRTKHPTAVVMNGMADAELVVLMRKIAK